MQFLKDLPQITQLSIALVLVLLPVLAVMVLRRRRKTATTPADGATRKERARRPRAPKAEDGGRRRRRRRLAAEAGAVAATEPVGEREAETQSATDGDPDDIVIESPEEIIPVALDLSVGDDETPSIEDPYVVATPTLISGDGDSSVAEPGWPSPGELASGFDPDAFDPLPPQAAHADGEVHAEAVAEDTQPTTTFEIPADDGGETWLDEDLTVSAPITVTQTPQDDEDVLVIAETESSVDWDEDDEFDPATGWIDDQEPTPSAESTDDEPWDDDFEDDQSAEVAIQASLDDEDDDDHDMQAPRVEVPSDEDDDDPDAEHTMMVQWPEPQFDDALTAPPDQQVADVALTSADEWADDEDLTTTDNWDDDWDESEVEPVVDAADLAVPFPPPGTLPEHTRPAVPFPALDILPAGDGDTRPVQSVHAPFADASAELQTESPAMSAAPQMPAITGLVGTSASGAPVVIDLAKLVAHGERIEMVIEQDANGHGVRLSFEASPATVPAPGRDPLVDATDDFGPADVVPATSVVSPSPDADPLHIPLRTRDPRPSTAGWTPVDEQDVPAEDRFVPTPTVTEAPATDTVIGADVSGGQHPVGASAVASPAADGDDPTRILSDIRARLAALDRRHLNR